MGTQNWKCLESPAKKLSAGLKCFVKVRQGLTQAVRASVAAAAKIGPHLEIYFGDYHQMFASQPIFVNSEAFVEYSDISSLEQEPQHSASS